jgi:hypothetical protein
LPPTGNFIPATFDFTCIPVDAINKVPIFGRLLKADASFCTFLFATGGGYCWCTCSLFCCNVANVAGMKLPVGGNRPGHTTNPISYGNNIELLTPSRSQGQPIIESITNK